MAVLAEALSVIVPVNVLNARLAGGLADYRAMVPNRTLCTDGRLTRVGFMVPADVKAFVENLEGLGLRLKDEHGFAEIAVVDQLSGPTQPCSWIRFARHAEGYSSVRLVDELSVGQVAAPDGWECAHSLSLRLVTNEEMETRLIDMGQHDGNHVLLDTRTGRETYASVANTTGGGSTRPSPRAFPVIVQHEKYTIWWVDCVEGWPGLTQVLQPRADVYMPFFGGPWRNGGNDTELTLRGLILGILVADAPPEQCDRSITAEEAERALRFASRAIGSAPDECMSSAGAYLAETVDDWTAVQALHRACVLLPESVFARGDLVVRLFELARLHSDQSAQLLRKAATEFNTFAPGATANSKNETAVLMYGVASLWLSGDDSLTRAAIVKHLARLMAQPDAVEWLRSIGVTELSE